MMNCFRNGVVLFFLCIVFSGHSQTSNSDLQNATEEFIQIQRTGSYSNLDSLRVVFTKISEEKNIQPQIMVEALLFQSRLLAIKNRFSEALSVLERAKSVAVTEKVLDSKTEHILAYYSMFLPQQISKHRTPKSARDYFKSYESKAGNDPFIEALSYEYMGRIEQDLENYNASKEYLILAIEKLGQLGYKAPLSVTYSVLGATYDLMEDFEMAAKSYEKSLAIGAQLAAPNYNVLASTSFNLSLLYGDRLGNSELGIRYAQEAIKYDIAYGGEENPYLALDYNRLVSGYSAMADYAKAQLFAEKAVAHAKLYFKKQPSRIAEALRALSSVYSYIGRGDEAIELGEEAMAMVGDIVSEEHRWVCANYLHMANVYLRLRNYKRAEDFFLKTERVAIAIDRDLFLIDAYQNLAEIYLKTGNLKEMKLVLDKAKLKLNDRFKNADYFHRSHDLSLAKYSFAIGDHASGRQTLMNLTRLLTNRFTYPDIEIQMIAYDVFSRDNFGTNDVNYFISQIIEYRNMFPNNSNKVTYSNSVKDLIGLVLSRAFESYAATKEESWLPVIFVLMELNKNSILLEGIRNAKLKQIAGIPKELIAVEQALTDSLQKNNTAIYNAKQTSVKSSTKMQLLFDRQLDFEETYDSLQQEINSNYPKLSRLKNLSSNRGFPSFLKNSLESDQMIVEYFIDARYWYRFAITKDRIDVNRFATSKVLQNDVKELLHGIATRKYDVQKAKKIHRLLIPKTAKEIEKLTLITDGVLSLLPFEVLRDDEGFLVDQFAISYAGSLQLLEEQMLLSKAGNDWLGFAPSYLSSDLPNNFKEVSRIQQITKGTSFIGETATKENFISESGRYDLLHLATHTQIDHNNPLYNKMIFANSSEDRELTTAEIYSLNLKANLAVLSSCNTGFGRVEAGEGVMSMSRAFTFAGVSSTLMTLWKVPDQESAEITAYFYENLETGQTKDVALQNAKKTYLNNHNDQALQEPFFWAGFVLSGDTTPVTTNSIGWYWTVGILVFVGLGFYLYKRKPSLNGTSS